MRSLCLVFAVQQSFLVKSGLRRTQNLNERVPGNMITIPVQFDHCNAADSSQQKVYETLKEKVSSTGSAQFSSINVYIQWRFMLLCLGLFDEFLSITQLS